MYKLITITSFEMVLNFMRVNTYTKYIFLALFCSTFIFTISRFGINRNGNNEIANDYNESQLLNLTNFQYILKTEPCRNFEKPLLGIIIVTSYVKHSKLRMAHRYALPQCRLGELGFQRIFLLADIPPTLVSITHLELEHEQSRFGDLLQGNFYDTYHNLTYKHIMGLRWASHECRMAQFIVKLDDDVIYDVYYLRKYLNSVLYNEFNLAKSDHFLSGDIVVHNQPLRANWSKWCVSTKEFGPSIYPYYLSGYFYITNPLTAMNLVREAAYTPFFWIDDVWVTGIIRHRLNIPLQSKFAWVSYSEQLEICCITTLAELEYDCIKKVSVLSSDNIDVFVKFQMSLEMCYNQDYNKSKYIVNNNIIYEIVYVDNSGK